MDRNIIKTACPRDCLSGCTIDVHVEDGKIVKVEGGKGNRATGGVLCAKGMHFIDYVYSPNRLKYPMARVGHRGEGKFERITWDDAVERICQKLEEVKDKYGPLGVMHYPSGGCKGMLNNCHKGFFNQYGGYSTKRGNLCCSAGIEAVKITYGELKQNAPWDIENAKLIVLWGKNPANTNIHEMKYLNNAISKGCKLVSIDPVKTASCARSHLHISPNPGTDLALALCVMNLLIQRGSIDNDFIEKHTQGFDELKNHVSRYPLEEVSRLCGVEKEQILSFIELIENNKPMTLICGFGVQRYKNGGQTVRAVSMIPALTGDVGRPGSGFRFAGRTWAPRLTWPFAPKDGFTVRDDYAASMLAEALHGYSNPGISMLWIERANPLVMHPDVTKLKSALFKPDFIVVVDQFLTDTAKYADVLLPAQSFFEFSDIFTNDWSPYISLYQKSIEPYYESKNESEIYRMLGMHMGYDMNYLPEYNDDAINTVLKGAGVNTNVESLKTESYTEGDIAYTDSKFNTPSGKIELYSESMIEKFGAAPLPEFDMTSYKLGEEKYPLRFLSTHARERIHSQFADIKGLDTDKALLYINPKDADERDIIDDDKVEIFNGRGTIYGYVNITDTIKPGVVNIYEGLSEHRDASVNMLTGQEKSDIGWGATFYDCYVEVKKV